LLLRGTVWRVALVIGALSLTGCFDNIYPTENTDWTCSDGNESPGGYFCQTDNELLRVGISTLQLRQWEESTQRIHEVLREEFDPTDLNVEWETPVYDGDAETDIVYELAEAGGGLEGVTWCNDAKLRTDECDQHYVRFDDDASWPNSSIICHETGHAVGLTHGEEASPQVDNEDDQLGCMQTPVAAVDDSLGTHNVDMINATYPQPEDEDGAPADA
jgi:hypothetical protein